MPDLSRCVLPAYYARDIMSLNWQSDSVTGWAQGDFNGDGRIDSSDLNDVGRNWLTSGAAAGAAGAAAAAAVPEPSGIRLVVLALFGSALLRRWRRCKGLQREPRDRSGHEPSVDACDVAF